MRNLRNSFGHNGICNFCYCSQDWHRMQGRMPLLVSCPWRGTHKQLLKRDTKTFCRRSCRLQRCAYCSASLQGLSHPLSFSQSLRGSLSLVDHLASRWQAFVVGWLAVVVRWPSVEASMAAFTHPFLNNQTIDNDFRAPHHSKKQRGTLHTSLFASAQSLWCALWARLGLQILRRTQYK